MQTFRYASTFALAVGVTALAVGCTSPPPELDTSCDPGSGSNATACETLDTGPGTEDTADADALDPWDDEDGDKVPNREDNCPTDSNPEQADADGDRVGDACDNCPNVANHSQKDTAPDSPEGDACDEPADLYDSDRDSDGDGRDEVDDNCPRTENPNQEDTDGDLIGDACDNCPDVVNPNQKNTNSTDVGNACSPEPVGPVCRRLKSDFKQFTPNLYFLLDKSGSMKGNKLNDAQSAIVTVAQKLQNRARFGLTAFSTNCAPDELLEMGRHNASSVQSSWSNVVAMGETGTGGALETIRTEQRFVGMSEDPNNDRPKAVLIVTDGKANVCGGQSKAKSEAQSLLANFGVKTFVVGFKSESDPSNLKAIAKAGGTKDYLKAENESQLEQAATDIFKRIISCSFTLPEPDDGIDPNRIWVEIAGSYIDPGKFSYDDSSKMLTLDQDACKTLRNSAADPTRDAIKIVMGCPVECESEDELCDYRDNDCDGEVDEDCEDCEPEVCNGEDDDCDGVTDEGCPDCRANGENCAGDDACCSNTCQAGTCVAPCHPQGAVCTSDDECCSGTCGAASGSSMSVCVEG